MTININLDNRLQEMNERKQLLHLKNDARSELTRVATTEASEDHLGNMSANTKSAYKKQGDTMNDSKRDTMLLEVDSVQHRTLRPVNSLRLEDIPPSITMTRETNSAVRSIKPSFLCNPKEMSSDY